MSLSLVPINKKNVKKLLYQEIFLLFLNVSSLSYQIPGFALQYEPFTENATTLSFFRKYAFKDGFAENTTQSKYSTRFYKIQYFGRKTPEKYE